jgi:hypothetical protein
MTINGLIKINGTEITEHNRKISINFDYLNNDLELASGSIKRFYKMPSKTINLNWSYLPDKPTKTVDLRVGRDFLHSLVTAGSTVTLLIQEDEQDEWQSYTCLIATYSETLLKNVIDSQCKYYDVSMALEDLS